jgi:hypothetical protein
MGLASPRSRVRDETQFLCPRHTAETDAPHTALSERLLNHAYSLSRFASLVPRDLKKEPFSKWETEMMSKKAAFALTLMFALASANVAFAQNAPQYQSGTTQIPTSKLAPQGTTHGTALNGNSQVSIPKPGSNNTYYYGQNASTSPSPGQPGSVGGVVGVGKTF